MSYLDDKLYKPLDPVMPPYKPLNLDPIYKPKPLYDPIKIDPVPTYKPEPRYDLIKIDPPIKIDPLHTYKAPEMKPLIGRWCSRKGTWCYEPVCRRTYGLPPKHAHTHLTGHHKLW